MWPNPRQVLRCNQSIRNPGDDKVAVGPWLLALFIFVVCGSGKCTCTF
ncbi:unnamed protein product [Oncorhynchus mykiss]|uniref:Stress-associated endoplasmic reticulum protein n=1 Tax=Oncorhynchus mykiss TaxID=8022 RepID=A0A060WXS5_ONCMY|nr:unnamed protein product [Oncorhynchus mykiss]